MRINTNISAIIANNQLQATEGKLSKSLERLSSGLRINRAADDSAGMAIASKMRTQIRGLDQSSRNAADGVSIVQTAEGALHEVSAMLQRMRELSVQGANGTYTDEDRDAIQMEVEALQTEIERIATDTEFNKKPLLDGTLDRRSYSDHAEVDITKVSDSVKAGTYAINITGVATQAEVTGGTVIDTTNLGGSAVGTISINGYSVEIESGDTPEVVFDKLIKAGDKLDINVSTVSSDPFATGESLKFTTNAYGTAAEIKIECSDTDLAVALGIDSIVYIPGENTKAEFITDAGARIGFSNSATMVAKGKEVTITDKNGFSMTYEVDPYKIGAIPTPGGINVNAEVTDIGTLTVHIGANEGQVMEIRIPEISLKRMGIDDLNLHTADGCNKAISALDEAISFISSTRASLGAYQNRLDSSIASLDATGENMTAALSRIEDVDMAEEMSTYTQLNVLSQAGVSMVAQANERPQTILQMLQ